MKTNYIKPCTASVELGTESFIAYSDRFGVGNSKTDADLTNERRGKWGNLWSDPSAETESVKKEEE